MAAISSRKERELSQLFSRLGEREEVTEKRYTESRDRHLEAKKANAELFRRIEDKYIASDELHNLWTDLARPSGPKPSQSTMEQSSARLDELIQQNRTLKTRHNEELLGKVPLDVFMATSAQIENVDREIDRQEKYNWWYRHVNSLDELRRDDPHIHMLLMSVRDRSRSRERGGTRKSKKTRNLKNKSKRF